MTSGVKTDPKLKVKVLSFLEKRGTNAHMAAHKFKVPYTTIRNWIYKNRPRYKCPTCGHWGFNNFLGS